MGSVVSKVNRDQQRVGDLTALIQRQDLLINQVRREAPTDMNLMDYLKSNGIKPLDEETIQESIPRESNQTVGTNDDIQLRSFNLNSSGANLQLSPRDQDNLLNNSLRIMQAKEEYFRKKLQQNIINLTNLHRQQRFVKREREHLWLQEKYLKKKAEEKADERRFRERTKLIEVDGMAGAQSQYSSRSNKYRDKKQEYVKNKMSKSVRSMKRL